VKLLFLVLVGLLIAWQWRSYRDREARKQPPPHAGDGLAIEMVACLSCGIHVASLDAIPGRQGSYCSVGHRQRHEA
jgi:uncharacterized protein